MAQSSRTFRVFVSSTFSDLKAERNALQEKVFPRLRDLATAHGCRFQAIDLRWGVSEEAALDQQTIKICLGEIERCQKTSPRPNFIVLLGDRYGWQPTPSEILADEFEQIIPLVTKEEKKLLAQWYLRDDNAVPPVYLLQPRTGEFIEYENWERIEVKLRRTFQSVIKKISLSPKAALKYTASATEQEIVAGALNIPDASEHVFCFLRGIQGLPDDSKAAAFCETAPEATQKQTALKKRLRKQLLGNFHEYTAQWQEGGPSQGHLDQLCKDVYAELSKVILAETGKLEKVDPLDAEIAAHEIFGKDRARIFIGRADILKAIKKYITANDSHPLTIWGASGSGKSALMAKAVEQASENKKEIIYRFIGATPESSNGRALLESLCKQISRRYGADESTIPAEYKDLVQEFPKQLALATPDKPFVLFLDALDQLSDTDNARNLAWLPRELPPNVHLIVSTIPGECLQALENKLPAEQRVEVQPMSVNDGQAILGEWLKEANRKLQNNQVEYLLAKFKKCGLPLYLKLEFEEARLWKSYDPLPPMGDDIPGILRDLFARLSQESNHGGILVSRSLGYLAAAKNGLSEDELLDVLSLDAEVLKNFHDRSPKSPDVKRLPIVVWSRLYFDLEPYLTERSVDGTFLLAFYHRQMGEAVTGEYLSSGDKSKRHQILAQYFGEMPITIDSGGKKAPNLRKLSEQPFQETYGGMGGELVNTLTNYSFLEIKIYEFGIQSLIDDYVPIFESETALYLSSLDSSGLRLIHGCLLLSSHILQKDKNQLASQLFGRLSGTFNDRVKGLLRQARLKDDHPWLCPLTNTLKPPVGGELRTIITGSQRINCLTVTPDGMKFIFGDSGGNIGVYDLAKGKELYNICDQGFINCVAVSPNGQIFASVADNIRLWDVETGREICTLEEKTNVAAVVFAHDGLRLITSSVLIDHIETIQIWDIDTKKVVFQLTREDDTNFSVMGGEIRKEPALYINPERNYIYALGESGQVGLWDLGNDGKYSEIASDAICFTITPDWKRAIVKGSYSLKDIRIHNLLTKKVELEIETGQRGIVGIVLTPDGNRLISAGREDIKIWDLGDGQLIRTLRSFDYSIKCLTITPDGKQVISGGFDGEIKIWNAEKDDSSITMEGHTDEVNTVAITRDGKKVFSFSKDHTARVWDMETGKELYTIRHTKEEFSAINFSTDGRYAILGFSMGEVKILNLNTWQEESDLGFDTLTGIHKQLLMADGRHLISLDGDGQIEMWDIDTWQVIWNRPGTHGQTKHLIVQTPDSQKIINVKTGILSSEIVVINPITGEEIDSVHQGDWSDITAAAVTPDGVDAIFADRFNVLHIWNIEKRQETRDIRAYRSHSGFASSLAVTPDGRQIVSGGMDQSLLIWDFESGQEVQGYDGHKGKTLSVAISPDGKQIISGSKDKTLKKWNLEPETEIKIPTRHNDEVIAIAIDPDGERVISVSKNDAMIIWSLETGQDLQWGIETSEKPKLQGKLSGADSGVITPDQRFLISGSDDNTLIIWDLNKEVKIRTLKGHEGAVNAVAVTRDGKYVISGSRDKTIKVWEIINGELSATYYADFSVESCAASLRDRKFICGDSDGRVHFLELLP